MMLLSFQSVTKYFGALKAVDDISFEIKEGSIVGLIGPNGAGKTTVFNLITGNYAPTSGDIRFRGKSLLGLKPHVIVELGIARTFQAIRLFQSLPVIENVLAGRHCRMSAGMLASILRTSAQKREEQFAIKRAMEELEFVGLGHYSNELAGSLSYGNQRLVEIARALASDPKILILDEPAGSMNESETAVLSKLVKNIQKRGITVVLIEHDMHLVMQSCERLFVLEQGALIAHGTPESIRNNCDVINAYLGHSEYIE